MHNLYTHSINKTILILALMSVGFLTTQAQDVIILKTGEKLEVKIIEVNDVEIKYREYRDPDGIIFTMSRGKIREVRYEMGRREKEEGPGFDPAFYVDDRLNNIKINFLAIGNGHTILAYERGLSPRSGFEVQLKLNGLGFENDYGKAGFGLDAGYKMKIGSLFKKRDEYRPKHILEGGYFRPVLGFNYASYDEGQYTNYTYAHFGLDFGTQWILSNIISLELFTGWHYYGGNFKDRYMGDIYYDFWEDGNLSSVSNNSAIAFGFNVGILFGKAKPEKK